MYLINNKNNLTMKKFLVLLSSIAFIAVFSFATANAQEPEKKVEKPKTEKCCSKEKSKKCPTTCEKKAIEEKKKEEVKKTEEKKK